jgi:hypothetical protein
MNDKNKNDSSFRKLLSPLSVREFLTHFFDRQPVLIKRHSPQYFSQVATIETFNQIVHTFGLRFPSVQVVSKGEYVPVERYTGNYSWGKQVFDLLLDPEKLIDCFADGCSLIFQALHLHSKEVGIFCAEIESLLDLETTANAYVTPPKAQALLPHQDDHSVFILQIHGTKEWKVEPGVILFNENEKRKTLSKFILFPGDTLYLPPNILHSSRSLAAVSAHITMGAYQAFSQKMQEDRSILSRREERNLLEPWGELGSKSILRPRKGTSFKIRHKESEVHLITDSFELSFPDVSSAALRKIFKNPYGVMLKDLPGLNTRQARQLARALLNAGAIVSHES